MMLNAENEKELHNEEMLQGLLFIENLRNIRFENDNHLNIIIRGFWAENIILKECLIDKKINHLEMFSVPRNHIFLDKVMNNHLIIELHQNDNKVIGIAELPLHQFYIAFKDSEITNRLFKESLPVTSVDDWVPVINPVTNDCYAYLKSLLAMGTEEQINRLKEKHNLTPVLSSQQTQFKNTISNCDSMKIMPKHFPENYSKQKCNGISSNHLGNFIENLIHQRSLNTLTKNCVNNVDSEENSRKLQTRKTSDLLEALNKALATPPSENDMFSLCFDQFPTASNSKSCKTLIEIERAVDLPRNTMKIGNKKISKRSSNNNGGSSKRKQSRFAAEEEPSAYVTFHAGAGYGQMVKSHEGFVYATNVIERNCNPIWGRKFEVPVPLELFMNNEKRFILKVWRKLSTDLAQCRYQPLPMEDIVIGFSSVDVSSLKTGNQIMEWFNIIDHNGRVHGRIKIKIKPLDDLDKLKQQLNEIHIRDTCPIVPNQNMNWTCNNIDFNNTPLSRAIKRKFTELEEITERLRVRLLGVTGDLDDNDDDDGESGLQDDDEKDPLLKAQLDEFEHDLNTACEEDDDDDGYEKYKNCDWLLSIQQNKKEREIKNDENTNVQMNENSQENIQAITDVLSKAELNNTNTSSQMRISINTSELELCGKSNS